MPADLEQDAGVIAKSCFSFLDGLLLRTKNALSRRWMLWPVALISFALFARWAGIQIHAYYIYKAYGLHWFEDQLPSVSEVSSDCPLHCYCTLL